MTSRRRPPGDWHLYLVLDKSIIPDDKKLVRIAECASRSGASAIQLRDKGGDISGFIRLAKRIKKICERYKVPFIINDRVEVALAVGSDGLHVGQSDIGAALARRLLGRGKVLGVSAGNYKEAVMARRQRADYIGVGPVFATPLKKNKRPLGRKFLKKILKFELPVILIGGINLKNAKILAAIGARRIAVIRAVLQSRSPHKAVKQLKENIV